MTTHHPRRRRGLRARAAAVAAGTLALTLGVSVAASASDAAAASGSTTAARHAAPATSAFSSATADSLPDPNLGWSFPLNGRDSSGTLWDYAPKSGGGFAARENSGTGFGAAGAFFQNNSGDGTSVNMYARFGGTLRRYGSSQSPGTVIGSGWQIYNAFVTPGNLGGAVYPDLLARDTGGTLWVYLSYADGHFTSRTKVGAGWNIYSQIAGRGDLTGDGNADIVARDSSGTLWLYKGTGDYHAPFAPRTKIGAGWNIYNKILGLGDSNGDGLNDLIARDTSGGLWLYPGTGNATTPYGKRQNIGTGWNVYNYLF
ncbi:FG-GAP repeat domain-containing protein [Actinacidiphila rubida]|uniref:Repeat domain-containing protein n=1 Tax=Actinacidiphila rubida TaxID=310780 RepID=A0A1H8H6M2_9ACTN|nr:VCBS repeat-containing protein [Actinacidiphila rubida]SEN51775.1 Repeat domain-containing protein [Actinacidiphila rubida]